MNDRKPQKARPAARKKGWFRSPVFKALLAVFLLGFIASSAAFLYFYTEYTKVIDRRLNGEVFKHTARIYATPYRVYPGQKLTVSAVLGRLARAGLNESNASTASAGVYEVTDNRVTIRPNEGAALRLDFEKDRLVRINKAGGGQLDEAFLPAELVTNLFDETRQKRRLVEYDEMPKHLVNALVAAEDRRFYNHYGVDPIRLVGAVVASIRNSDRVEGVSTLTQQLARNFFLTLDRSMERKAREAFIAVLLEQRLTKEEIITMYANEVYLGNRGSFGIHGFGEAAAAYFGKDLSELTLAESATLAGVIPSPNTYSPSKYPDRAKTRRNLVLTLMHDLGMIDTTQFEASKIEDVAVAPIKLDASDAPYLVDYIRNELLGDYTEESLVNDNLSIYTTIDPDLQRAAVDAVEKGLSFALEQISGRPNPGNLPGPQAALIALDARTGEIKAMVGGSNYGASQYNRITEAFRQPGSIFKPLVYAAAFEAAFDGQNGEASESPASETTENIEAAPPEQSPEGAGMVFSPMDSFVMPFRRNGVITPISTFVDEPTTFVYEEDRIYEPNNYKEQYRGLVTVRTSLQHSLNIPTIKVAEQIGFDRVADFAKRMGLNAQVKGYPSIALGAFEVTPLEMAGAYTAFANEGKRSEPHALVRVVAGNGNTIRTYEHEPQEVMRPELSYLITNLLEGVVNSGTGAGVRARGFRLPAAGKTGTSRDGWFAGYTKDLVAIAWVGYDDNRDLNLEGSRSALPIWTEFMLKAYQLYPVTDMEAMYFEPPSGVDFVRIDPVTGMIARASCIDAVDEVFISGTAPTAYCSLHGFRISDAIQNGVRESGSAVGRAFGAFGRALGRVFGSGNADDADDDDDADEEEALRRREQRERQERDRTRSRRNP